MRLGEIKLKKTISLMLAVIITMLGFTSCASSKPKEILKSKLDALISGDYDAVDVDGTAENQTGKSNEYEDTQKKIRQALYENMSYKIGKSTIHGDKAKVEVKINTIDMSVVKNKYFLESKKYLFNDKQWDPNGEGYLKLITDENAIRDEFAATVNMTKENGNWIIDNENKDFYNALLGGMNGYTGSR